MRLAFSRHAFDASPMIALASRHTALALMNKPVAAHLDHNARMSILMVRCTSAQCQHTTAIAAPNGAWKPLVPALQHEGWMFAKGVAPEVVPVTRSVAAGLGRQRLRLESLITIHACCPQCHEQQSFFRAVPG